MNNSLTDEIDITTILGEIIALRAYAQKSLLIVEGPGDLSFFSAFVSHEMCDIVISHGRSYSIQIVHEMDGKFEGVLAIVDQDLDALFEGVPTHRNIAVTDTTDVEIMMIRSSAFDSVIWELASVEKLGKLVAGGFDPRSFVLNAARRIFILKFISRRENLGLRFRDLRLNFVSRELKYSTETMVLAVLNHSRKTSENVSELAAEVDALDRSDLDQWAICSGHILCGFIGKALQRVVGTLNSNTARAEEIESRLRTAFSDWHFKSTCLFNKVREWEGQNRPYVILNTEL